MKKSWVFLAIAIWVGVGLWFARDDLDYIAMLAKVAGNNAYDQRMYLYGSDYQTYDYLATNTPTNAKILELVPDSYYYSKALFFWYPRENKTIGDPFQLAAEIAKEKYDYVYVYNPPENYYWGAVRASAWKDQFNWDNHVIYQQLVKGLGKVAVGSEAAYLAKLNDYFGNAVYKVETK